MGKIEPRSVPSGIQDKIEGLKDEINQILESAYAIQKAEISGRISFEYKFGGGRDILTDFERAQSICFFSRYESLPEFNLRNVRVDTHGLTPRGT